MGRDRRAFRSQTELQAGEKCSEEDLPMKLVELFNQRKKLFAQQRAEAKRNKPMTLAQQKEYMSNYIMNQEGDDGDTLWKLQRYMHDPLVWRLYDTCNVHHVSSVRGHDIFMLVEKYYPLSKALMMLMLVTNLSLEQSSEMANEFFMKNLYTSKQSKAIRCLDASSQHKWFNFKKLDD
ncbi:hypothetical protein Tco_1310152 [Tanacetum coccineum]